MALKDGVYPVVADVSFTTAESSVEFDPCFKLVLLPDTDCSVSFTDNTHYKKYLKGQAIPVELSSSNSQAISKLYIKGLSASGSLGVWGYK